MEHLDAYKRVAVAEIQRLYGTEEGEYGATLFADHHLEELEPDYWQAHLGVDEPKPIEVLEMIVLESHWVDESSDVDVLDFTLPGDITDYVIAVRFDENGQILSVGVES